MSTSKRKNASEARTSNTRLDFLFTFLDLLMKGDEEQDEDIKSKGCRCFRRDLSVISSCCQLTI